MASEIEWRAVPACPTSLPGFDLFVNGARMGCTVVTSMETAIGYAGDLRLGHFNNEPDARVGVLRALGLKEKLQ